MHQLQTLLSGDFVRCNLSAVSRKRALQLIAEMIADEEAGADVLFDALMSRERLGSTGLGDGVAIPHCRVQCSRLRAAFVSLPEGINYEASDGEPVDLLFALVVPQDEQQEHLDALAALAGVFSNADNRAALRGCTTDDQLKQTICDQLAGQVPNAISA
jgi:PTS system nitrogen regulatory IIA component